MATASSVAAGYSLLTLMPAALSPLLKGRRCLAAGLLTAPLAGVAAAVMSSLHVSAAFALLPVIVSSSVVYISWPACDYDDDEN
jgi:hypothetical protein